MNDRTSSLIRETAQRNYTTALKALAELSQTRAAELMGVSDTTVCRLKSSELEQICTLLAACCLRVTPTSCEVYDEAFIAALRTLARHGINASPKSQEVE
jgi:hypothetical protein